MAQFTYRLQLLLEQKEDAKREAERELARREHELEMQVAALRSLQQRQKELVERRERLRRELMAKPGEQGTLMAHEVLERSEFVKVVGLQIDEARNDVQLQRTVVETYELKVQEAKKSVEEAKREVEVLTKHRAKQEERFLREQQAKEDLELDEVGNVLYTTRRRPS
jgi:flagellar biosynthesis chaperone FliJ